MRTKVRFGSIPVLLGSVVFLVRCVGTPAPTPPAPTPHWQAPQRISGPEARTPVVNNGGWIVWVQTTGTLPRSRRQPQDVFASRYDGSGWTAPQNVSRSGTASAPALSGLGTVWSVAVWQEVGSSGLGVIRASFIDSRAVSWSAPVTISDSQGDATQPAVAAVLDGPRTAWLQRSAGGTTGIWSARLISPPNNWGAPESVGPASAGEVLRPRIAGGGSDFVVLWVQESRIFANRFLGSASRWTGAEQFPSNFGRAGTPFAAMDSSGGALAVWSEWLVGAEILSSHIESGSAGWSAPVMISDDVLHADVRPKLAFLENEVIAIWAVEDSFVRRVLFRRNPEWTAARSEILWLPPPAADSHPDFPLLSRFGSGALAVWQTRRDLWAASFEPSTGWGNAEIIGSVLSPIPIVEESVERPPDLEGTATLAGASLGFLQPTVGIVAWEQPAERKGTGSFIWARIYR